MKLLLGEDQLSIDSLEKFLSNLEATVELSPATTARIEDSRKFVTAIAQNNRPVYGINTGFGALSDKFIAKEQLAQLQLNLIRSHCTGIGNPLSEEWARLLMVLRSHCLAIGYSGIQLQAIKLMTEFINKKITPIIPSKGSVGASGDLAPLAHFALCLLGEGDVVHLGQKMTGAKALEINGLKPLSLGAKDGLALINGTSLMGALSVSACIRARKLFKLADIAASMTLEATRGTRAAFHSKITKLKPHPGQLEVVENFKKIAPPSAISESHANCGKVQDPYSLRCVPQVHGACRQTLKNCIEVTEIEINSVTDNPLIFSSSEVFSGGNFHGEAIALAMDYLSMGTAELCNISERRIEKMMNPSFSDLPAFLIEDGGLNSGLMIAQVTAAALVSENKILAHPASIDSVPTSNDKEDHVSMGVTSGLKLHQILDNLENVLAIEFLCNTQGLHLLAPLKSSPAIEAVHSLIRNNVPPIIQDRNFSIDINLIRQQITKDEILKQCEQVTGKLQ